MSECDHYGDERRGVEDDDDIDKEDLIYLLKHSKSFDSEMQVTKLWVIQWTLISRFERFRRVNMIIIAVVVRPDDLQKYLSILIIQLRNCDEDHFFVLTSPRFDALFAHQVSYCSDEFVLTLILQVLNPVTLSDIDSDSPVSFFFLLSTDTYHFPVWSVFDIVCHDTCRSRIFASRVTSEHDRYFVGISGQIIWQRNTSSDVNYIKLLTDYVLVGDR